MPPLPYPHRATFLASTLSLPPAHQPLATYLARLLSIVAFDALVRHPVVTLGDHDDERLIDDNGGLLDANHPQFDESLEWFFRISRRHEVLWFDVSFDPATPRPPALHSRRPAAADDRWSSHIELPLSAQLSQCIAAWLTSRRLPSVPKLSEFSLTDLVAAASQLAQIDKSLVKGSGLTTLATSEVAPPERVAVPFLRVLAELAREEARALDPVILDRDPTHPVARRNRYVTALLHGEVERRDILPLVAEAPMYAKPHLSIWGEPFAADHPLDNMGVRHQGIAASLMPANPYACHNYSLQLAEVGRREESYRWADRATVAAPHFAPAHLDCVRRLRQVGRPGQAYAEAQYRCREILDRASSGKLPTSDWQAPHHAALLIAFAHLDVGRLAEAIELADEALGQLPTDGPTREAFAWAHKRVNHWKNDAGLLARAYAWEGYHRADPGRVIAGLSRGRLTDDDDAMMWIDSLVAVGRDEQAEIAYWHCAGIDGGILGDGKARLAGAKALILRGNLDEALDQIQIVQLRRGQSRLEGEINRLLRLAATRPATEWERTIGKRLERGALTLAQRAARDLGDFVPGLDTAIVKSALGERRPIELPEMWTSDLIGALPAAQSSSAAIVDRLAVPKSRTLAAADGLAQEWWTVLVPPARDRDAHAAGAVLALAVATAHYFTLAAQSPSPLTGAYRHIATEALHLVRRSRYQIDVPAIRALLGVYDALAQAPEWLLDVWLARVERALDLEAEHGSYLAEITNGMPTIERLLRGDERIGWELRLANDLAADPSQYEAAATLFERCARIVEGGSVELAWSTAASAATERGARLDIHWLAALANPTGIAAPWLRIAHGLLAGGRASEAVAAAARGLAATPAHQRAQVLAELAPAWSAAKVATPLDGDGALQAGLAAAARESFEVAVTHLRWAVAHDPSDSKRAHSFAVALGRAGNGLEAVRVLSHHDRFDAPRSVGRLVADCGRYAEALTLLRYASRRFRSADDWGGLSLVAAKCDNDAVCVEAGKRAIALGATDPSLLIAVARALYRMGDFVECERVAQQLIGDKRAREVRVAGLHAMARALAGQGRHVDAHPYAKAAAELGPNGSLAADLIETMDRIVAQQTPPTRPSIEMSMERMAFYELEQGNFDAVMAAVGSPSWGIARVALAACEFRRDDESGIPVSPRALEAAVAILARTEGASEPDAVLARIRALRIRDNAFIQIDPPPPLGVRCTRDEFAKLYADRERRPQRPSALLRIGPE